MEEIDFKEEKHQPENQRKESRFREEICSKCIRAGRRTYFFDVKVTRRNEYYLTITESKKRNNGKGKTFYEKHKIFLYKEDFERFMSGLEEMFAFISEKQPFSSNELETEEQEENVIEEKSFTDVEFEDLPSV